MAELCGKCGSSHVDRVAVDIGVGTQYGPLQCFDCGWSEEDEAEIKYTESIDTPE
jgi:hypothetical protein